MFGCMFNALWRKTHELKMEAIKNMMPPASKNKGRQFIGLVKYYRYM